jgi:hypothetical protein
MKEDCIGNSRCLTGDYGNDKYMIYPMYKCKYGCKPKYCVNNEFCGSHFIDYHNDKIKCDSCIEIWKGSDPKIIKNKFVDVFCQICSERSYKYVKLPNCNHFMCIDCFQNKYTNDVNGTKWNKADDKFYYWKGRNGICAVCIKFGVNFFVPFLHMNSKINNNIIREIFHANFLKIKNKTK